MPQILNEELKSTLFEEVEIDKPKKGILKTIKGCVADAKLNRNGRIYPVSLWKRVIESDYVKELLSSKTLFGELDHPAERLEMSLQEVSHCIRDLRIQGDEVIATIDVLDTPNGNLVSKLIDYGSKIGVSSRGAGDVLSDNTVDPESYTFVGFDLVARPSCAAATPVLAEGAKVKLTESEIARVLEDYRNINNTIEEKSSTKIGYFLDEEYEEFKSKVLSDLINEATEINK